MSDVNRVESTWDGSPTLYSTRFKAHYHSLHGALQESRHVFIRHGLAYYYHLHSHRSISLLEYGFGTGLNAVLALQYSVAHSLDIRYHGLEGFPIDRDTWSLLDFHDNELNELTNEFHECPWNKECILSNHFSLEKQKILFEKFIPDRTYDIIFYDAFGPSSQPYLWEQPILKKASQALVKGGILVTYCAKGSFKRTLKSLGFDVLRLPGPPGKREMTRATKIK